MSKRKTRDLDRRRERRAFNAVGDTVKAVGHGARSGWKRYWGVSLLRPKPSQTKESI